MLEQTTVYILILRGPYGLLGGIRMANWDCGRGTLQVPDLTTLFPQNFKICHQLKGYVLETILRCFWTRMVVSGLPANSIVTMILDFLAQLFTSQRKCKPSTFR